MPRNARDGPRSYTVAGSPEMVFLTSPPGTVDQRGRALNGDSRAMGLDRCPHRAPSWASASASGLSNARTRARDGGVEWKRMTATPQPASGAGRTGTRRRRSVLSGLALVLACLTIVLAALGLWVHQVVLNTDRFTALASDIVTDPAVIDPVAARVSATGRDCSRRRGAHRQPIARRSQAAGGSDHRLGPGGDREAARQRSPGPSRPGRAGRRPFRSPTSVSSRCCAASPTRSRLPTATSSSTSSPSSAQPSSSFRRSGSSRPT